MIEDFLRDLDASWRWPNARKIRLHIIGSAALLLQSDYRRGTKDSDVLESVDLPKDTQVRLLELAGRGSAMHSRRRLYLDIVPNGLPFLPRGPVWHDLTDLNAALRHFELDALDIVDVVVSKLKRFSRDDLGDVTAMVDQGHVPHGKLIERFRSAVDLFSCDARAEDLPKIVRHLHRVERDSYGVEETSFELPSWIDDP